MSVGLIPIFALCALFWGLYINTFNPFKKELLLIFLIVALISSLLVFGVIEKDWETSLAFALAALIAHKRKDQKTSEVVKVFLFLSLSLVVVANTLPSSFSLLLSALIISYFSFFREARHIFLRSLLLVVPIFIAVFTLTIQFSELQWLNPSFILADTIVPSDIFYLDFAPALCLMGYLCVFLSLVMNSEPTTRSSLAVALGLQLVVLNTVKLEFDISTFSIIFFGLLLVAFLKDLYLVIQKKPTDLDATLSMSTLVVFVALFKEHPNDQAVFWLFQFVVFSEVLTTFLLQDFHKRIYKLFKNFTVILALCYFLPSQSINLTMFFAMCFYLGGFLKQWIGASGYLEYKECR